MKNKNMSDKLTNKDEQEIYLGHLCFGLRSDMGHLEMWSVDNDDIYLEEIMELREALDNLIKKMGVFEE